MNEFIRKSISTRMWDKPGCNWLHDLTIGVIFAMGLIALSLLSSVIVPNVLGC